MEDICFADFVNMVERQQCWSLPDPFDPTPIKQGIEYIIQICRWGKFCNIRRPKFKSAPLEKFRKWVLVRII